MGKNQSPSGYAKQVLKEKGIEVYAGEERILHREAPTYNIIGETPSYYAGEEFVEEQEIRIVQDYSDLRSMGIAIASFTLAEIGETPWAKHQKVVYKLVPDDGRYKTLAQWPPEHHVDYDQYNQAMRIVGKNAGPPPGYAGPWLTIIKKKSTKKINDPRAKIAQSIVTNAQKIISQAYVDATGIPEPPKLIKIPELPFMITRNNEIVCLDQGLDEPRIGIFGTTGMGKSYAGHAILDMAYHHPAWKRRIAIINDSQAENGTWSEPNADLEAERFLERFGITPKPLPMVYLHPTLEDEYEKLHYEDVGHDICLPYDIIIERFSDFFKLEASAKYFQELRDELTACRTKDELSAMLEKKKKKGALQVGTVNKILATLGNVLQHQITDASTGVPPYWTLKRGMWKRSYNPLTACIAARLVPCLETQTLISYDFFPQYYQYLVGDIFHRQNNDVDFRGQRIWLYVDEVLNVTSTEHRGALTLLTRTVTEGRIRRIGTILATQNYKKIPFRIRANIKTLLTFNNPEEATAIVKTYNLPSYYAKTIKNLKKFEMLAYTTDHFVIYDSNGGRRVERGPFIGKSLPTLSLHKKPLEERDNNE